MPDPAVAAMPRNALRVAVASEHSLIAESVRAALTARGFTVVVLRWPLWMPESVRTLRLRGGAARPQLGLIISDLDRPPRIDAARALLAQLDVPWIVLSTAPQGPAWGAVLDVGAEAVLTSDTTLDQLIDVFDAVANRQRDPEDADRDETMAELVSQWHDSETHRIGVEAGVATLTSRELEVLQGLHSGKTVRDIATRFETSEATVRSQVKSVLRKVGVSTQVAAAAAYEMIRPR